MVAKWIKFYFFIFFYLCAFAKSEDPDSSSVVEVEKEPEKPRFVESVNVTFSDDPSAKEMVEKMEQEKLNSTEQSLNSSSNTNSTDSEPRRPKWLCINRKMPENTSKKVLVINDALALSWINGTIANASGRCALVLFYAKFCSFCAKMAPLYNAIGRAVSDIPIIAIDAYIHTSLNARFGVVAVPTIMLFYNGKPVLKFNNTKTFEALKSFLTNNTGLTLDSSVEVSQQDYDGPLSSKPEHYPDYYLIFSAFFLFAFAVHLFVQSQYCLVLWNKVHNIVWTQLPVINLFFKPKRD